MTIHSRNSQPARTDVYVDHAPADGGIAELVADALRSVGLTAVCSYETGTQQDPRTTIGGSTLLLALYSLDYANSRRCQAALTTAFIVAQREGDPRARILVVNQEKTKDHIHPLELREGCKQSVTRRSVQRLKRLAEAAKQEVSKLTGPILPAGAQGPTSPWHGTENVGISHFVGRFDALWRIHRGLGGPNPSPNPDQPLVALVHGDRGVGKSAIVEEYGLRFADEYPGGVFWLRAYGTEDDESGMGTEERIAERDRQIRAFAADLGVIIAERNAAQVRAALGQALTRRGQRCLWIVDDLPLGLSAPEFEKWIGPTPLAATLVTTRSQEYDAMSTPIRIGPLTATEGHALLTSRVASKNKSDQDDARAIADTLGGHPLAIAVASGSLGENGHAKSLSEFRAMLSGTDDRLLDVARALEGEVPSELAMPLSIVFTNSFSGLDPRTKDYLRLAAVAAAAPIPATLAVAALAEVDVTDATPGDVASEVRQLDALGLTDRPSSEGGSCTVHRLLTKVARLTDPEPLRLMRVRAATVSSLLNILPASYDPGAYASLDYEITHARELTRRAMTPADAELLGRVARYDLVRGAYASAKQLYIRQHEVHLQLYGNVHAITAESLSNLAGAHFVTGHFDDAAKLHLGALTVRKDTLGVEHPDTIASINSLATTYQALAHLDQALELREEAFDVRRRMHGDRHPKTTTAAWNLYLTLSHAGATDRATDVLSHHLSWLREAEPTAMSTDQRRIRDLLAHVV